jgi:hypothetical protein
VLPRTFNVTFGLPPMLRIGAPIRLYTETFPPTSHRNPTGRMTTRRTTSPTPTRDQTIVDYEIGFARLADPKTDVLSMGFDTEFRVTAESRYERSATRVTS